MRASEKGPTVSEEQLIYARYLAAGMYTGLALLLVTFVIYASGAMEAAVPIDRLPEYWSLSVEHYLESINANHLHREHALTGWWWLGALGSADYLCFVGIAVLAAVTILCYIRVTPTFLARRDVAYGLMAAAEAVILILAASGIFSVGH